MYEPYFPNAYGNEEETGMMVRLGEQSAFSDPQDFARNLDQTLPHELPYYSDGIRTFLGNGGLIYPGGNETFDISETHEEGEQALYDNIERATPECISPAELTVYIQAHEKLIVSMSQNYVDEWANSSDERATVRIQRRVVDSQGNRKGCHDNFGVDGIQNKLQDKEFLAPLLGFIATRPFITGAGYVELDENSSRPTSLQYAQKIGGLTELQAYGYLGSMYRVAHELDNERLEIRCNDINISPWAIKARVGGIALMLATLSTPLKDKVYRAFDYSNTLHIANQSNLAAVNDEGQIQQTRQLEHALRMQEYMADIFLENLPTIVDVPPHLEDIAIELKQYCIDFRDMLNGLLPMEMLADRSDVAAKFTTIINNRHADGKPLLSIESARDDMMYDHIQVSGNAGVKPRVHWGVGYEFRANRLFKDTPREIDVDRALYWPPKKTRAYVRSKIIREYQLGGIGWSNATLKSALGIEENILLGPVGNTSLSGLSKRNLDIYKKRV
jgi:hypothetical protein